MNVKSFLINEDGAVTVDWVVVTAAVAGLAILVISTFGNSSGTVADNISSALVQIEIPEIE